MATKYANVKGIRFLEEPLGANRGGIALISFDMVGGGVYTGGADTLQLGSAGASQAYENQNLSVPALTLATMIQNRRRDGRTVTLNAAMAGPAPGAQAAATNGPLIAVQGGTVTSGNVTCNLFSLAVGGSAITTTAAAWDRACTLLVEYIASYPSANPE